MKKINFSILAFILVFGWVATGFTQSIPTTFNCTPQHIGSGQLHPGWTVSSGSPHCSSTLGWAGNTSWPWTPGPAPVTPAGSTTFVGIWNTEALQTTMTGLTAGQDYDLTLSMHTSDSGAGGSQCPGGATTATAEVNGNSISIPMPPINTWDTRVITFTANATTATFEMVGGSPANCFVNWEVDINALALAVVPVCGNSVIESGETCDDGNAMGGDGCSNMCILEPGYTCPVPGSPCIPDPVCGNGVIESGETCDDGNTMSTDGCSNICILEPGFTCPVPGSPCIPDPVCGNSFLDPLESCDDGNAFSGDGCDDLCAVESGYTCPTVGNLCDDIDECALNLDNCGSNSTCVNNTGSFICACDLGYSNTSPSTCAASNDFSRRFDDTLKGKLVSASNVLITCDPGDSRCSNAQNFIGSIYQNETFDMVHVDVDGDGSTFNSSSADISFPAGSSVVFAGLYWGGQFTDDGEPDKRIPPPNAAAKTSVKFKVPGGSYTTVSGTVAEDNSFYHGFADVTNLVSVQGEYSVADAQLTTGQQMNGGWTLVVVVASDLEPLRRFVIWDGYVRHDGGDETFTLPDTFGTRNIQSSIEMTLMTYDGDKGARDSLRIDGNLLVPKNIYPIDDPAAAGDISNSTIRNLGVRKDNRNPSFRNTLGYDADSFEVSSLVDTDSDADLLFRTVGDVIHIGMIAFQSDVDQRFVQTDWSAGPTTGTSSLMETETGFLNRSGHVFHDSSVGDLRSVQFSYSYDGDLYEITPVRSNLSDNAYINSWLSNPTGPNAYPIPACNQNHFWMYRQVDISRVTWLYGSNGNTFACNGTTDATWAITGTFVFGSVGGQSTATGFNSAWANNGVSGHLFRFSTREFSIDGTMDARTGAPSLPEHSVTIDTIGTEVPYNWGAPAAWSLTSDFNGRLESKVFDGAIPRGFGNLSFLYTETNNSTAEVFFRTGDNEADVLSKAWEGPFDDGDVLGTGITNNHQFFQYAIEVTLADPAANEEESVLVVPQIYFDIYGIAIP